MDADEIRNLIPPGTRDLFDDVTLSRVLGAGNHITMIGKILSAVANDFTVSADVAMGNVMAVADFFMRTRGEESRAVYNAVKYFIGGLVSAGSSFSGTLRGYLTDRVASYDTVASENMEHLLAYGENLLSNVKSLMAFDYSSTVSALLSRLRTGVRVYLPESRCIDGGRPFLPACKNAGLDVSFIPDCAIYWALKKSEAVLIGAETFCVDGSAYNTIGSDMAAYICDKLNIPFYVATPMIKIDMRSSNGIFKYPEANGFKNILTASWSDDERAGVVFDVPGLARVPSSFITAYITEEGVVPASAIYRLAIDYAAKLEENNVTV